MATGLFNLKQVNQAISQGAWSGYIAPKWVEYLVVAGGGGGGGTNSGNAGGGGGGGLLTGIVTVAAGTSYTVTVGGGGNVGGSGATGSTGSSSVFGSISTTGGGGGAAYAGTTPGSGGSGGGAAQNGRFGGAGIAGQGNSGGGFGFSADPISGAGGGGAGTIGLQQAGTSANSWPQGGNGGAGIASSISGSVVTYAGGGGGSTHSNGSAIAVGGAGGGGNGHYLTTAGTSGGGNTGGGGGGAGESQAGGAGGSGIVVVRYPGSIQFFTGGTLSYANGYMIHTFYSSGTLAPTTPTPYVTDYQISRSLRFNSADSAYLNRTPASAGNRKTWTLSLWLKRSELGKQSYLFGATSDSYNANWTLCSIAASDQLYLRDFSASAERIYLQTNAVLRDVSAWYHILVSVDTTQATSSNRVKLYINNVEQSLGTATYPSQSIDTFVDSTNPHTIGVGSSNTTGGYMTEVNFIDGQALTPSSFGYTNPATGVWSPLAFVGTYGTNGFYLNFSDNSNTTAATLGKDYSGNGNNWTPNNFSVTAGAGNDSLVDSPTSYGTDTGAGGEVRGNYCTWNAVLQTNDAANTYANGNLEVSSSGSNWANGTISTNTGSYYFELTPSAGASGLYLGINNTKTDVRITAYSGGIEATAGGGSNQGSLAAWSNGDIIGVAVNGVSKTVQFYRNGSTYGTLVTYTTALDLFPFARNGSISSSTVIMNSGQRAFAYTAPSGYKALCTQNLPTPTIGATSTTLATQYFNPVLYTGNGSSQTISGFGFQPDLVWFKCRSVGGYNNFLFDAVRGVGKTLISNDTSAESNYSSYISPFTSDGYQIATTATSFNQNGQTFVSWGWKANGSGSTNTAGSITSTVSANTTSGFSVVTYTGTGSLATVGHGLGATPKMFIVKRRDTTSNWLVYNSVIGATNYLYLNTTDASAAWSGFWGNTAPTSTVFTVNNDGAVNSSGNTFVAYCFAEVAGYSKFGSYTGNGSTDGPFVFTGFRPAYLMWKRTDGISDWAIEDLKRDPNNVTTNYLAADLSDAEITDPPFMDFLSNGFKVRRSTNGTNASGGTYIFMAFATSPFKYSLAR